MEKNLIVSLADRNYFDQIRQLFSSVYHNSGWEGDYMVLAHQMTEEQISWFDQKGIIVKEIETIGNRVLPHHPRTVLSKFSLFSKDMARWKRIIYLDADTTVTASLDHLLQLRGFWASADFHDIKLRGQFKDPTDDSFGPDEKLAYDVLISEYDLNRISFNSGVMAFDGAFAGDGIYDRLADVYNKYESITLHDQSILNLIFYDKWNRLPLAFNNYFLYTRRPFSIRFDKCDGIVNHYILDRIWKTGNRDFFPVWKRNLDISDNIDLDRRPTPSNVWDETKVKEISDRLMKSHFSEGSVRGKILEAATLVDRGIGKIGLLIKRKSPRFYDIIHR